MHWVIFDPIYLTNFGVVQIVEKIIKNVLGQKRPSKIKTPELELSGSSVPV